MAQTKPKSNLPKLLLGAAVIAIIALYMTGGDNTPKTAAKSTSTKKSTANTNSPYTDEDRNANFPPITLAMQDKFVPLVYKNNPQNGAGGDRIDKSQLTIPTTLTGGEANWAFTGTVNVNGKWSALVENGTSAQSAYISPGMKWKSSTVDKVTENLLFLRDISGTDKEIPMQADIQASIAKQQADLAELRTNSSAAARNPNMTYAPYNPLTGPIGDATIQPEDGGAAASAGGNGGNGYGGNRRNRGGGRGGGRGGRGGGGFGNGG